MQLEHNFTVAAPVDRAWEVLLDLERIVPCMPGAALTSYEGDEFTGTVRVKLGPVVMTFAGKGRFVERDAAAHRMVIEAAGRDTRGAGSARAKINAALRADGDVTAVAVLTDLTISGRVAQFGRGMIADVSTRLLDEFTSCLAGQLAPPPAAAAAAPPLSSTTAPSADVGEAPSASAPSASAPSAAAPPAADPPAAAAGQPAATTDQPAAIAGAQPAAVAAQPGAVAAGQPAPAPDPQTASVTVPAPRGPAEPIDLLRVTGTGATARRIAPYLLTFLLGVVVGALLAAWLG